MATLYVATCRNPECGWTAGFSDYLARADAVGQHRIKTGHGVKMYQHDGLISD